MIPSSVTFEYFTIVPAEPWDERSSRWPVQLEKIDETGEEWHDSRPRLTGHSPYLEVTDGGRTPNPSVSRPSVFRSRLRLIASERKNSTVSSASFYVAKDLTSRFKPGDVLHMARTGCGGLGLSLLRENRLVFAVGAVSSVPLGDGVQAATRSLLVREAESVFRKVDPKFEFPELPLQISIGGHSRILFRGWLELGDYVSWVEHGYLPCIPGVNECASIALKGACGASPSSLTAQLLNDGEIEVVPWLRVERVSDDLYNAEATVPPREGGGSWSTAEPMDGKSLVEELMRRGWHVQDVVDAVAEVDPAWREKHQKWVKRHFSSYFCPECTQRFEPGAACVYCGFPGE